jgi:hypothetical protein
MHEGLSPPTEIEDSSCVDVTLIGLLAFSLVMNRALVPSSIVGGNVRSYEQCLVQL